MLIYKGSTAMITGASKGLGAAFAEELARRGMDLVLVARSIDLLHDLAKSLAAQYGVRCHVLQADLAASDAVLRLVTELERQNLKIDLLINNAGVGLTGNFLEHSFAAEQASIQVDVLALVGLAHAVGAKMALRGEGGIINVASNASFQPLPHMATYAAAKAFVLHFSEALGFELKGRGVQVMTVCPGPTATSFFDGVSTTIKSGTFDSADFVVRRTLRSFERKKSVAYPGRFSVRAATWLPRLLPRNVVVSAAALATANMGLARRHSSPAAPVAKTAREKG
ncbi:MAG TPA: SDR family oxidoreductase [Steroidobacteraceae bacterium]